MPFSSKENNLGGLALQNLSDFWSHIKKYLIETHNNPAYRSWFEGIHFLGSFLQDEKTYHIKLQASSDLHKTWFQNKVSQVIYESFQKIYENYHISIELNVSEEQIPLLPQSSKRQTSSYSVQSSSPRSQSDKNAFSPLYTFKNFVSGQNSDLAFKSAVGVSKQEKASETMNPLIIYGPSGLGKTHLLHAIGQNYLRHFPQKKVLYLSGERFLNQYVQALQNKTMIAFKKKFREKCDLLLIDDIHILARGQGVQEEFFHTFNELFLKKRQVVACSDQCPHYIQGFENRIKTRLAGGLVADISYPDYETRLAILKQKSKINQIFISKKALELISKNFQRSIREMEGVLHKIKMMTEMGEKKEISIQEVEKILQSSKQELTVNDIKRKVAVVFKVSLPKIASSSRQKPVVKARQTAMYFTRHFLKKSLQDICRDFERKDHTTVLNSIRKVEKNLKEDREFKMLFELIKQELEKEFHISV